MLGSSFPKRAGWPKLLPGFSPWSAIVGLLLNVMSLILTGISGLTWWTNIAICLTLFVVSTLAYAVWKIANVTWQRVWRYSMAKYAALLQGKVAKILNERDVVINIGRVQGVKKGMKFAILAPTPEEISDPETGELLDTVDRTKALIQVTEVRERITICSTYKTSKISGGIFSALYSLSRHHDPLQETPDGLEDFSLPALLSSEESYIKRGDQVKQVEEPDRV